MAKDFYDILGVSRGASDDEIKKAYRKAAHKHHPDKDGGDEAKFKEVNEAYQTLSDKNKRAQYDQFGQTFDGAGGGPSGGFGGFDFSQFQQGSGNGGFEFHFGDGGMGDIFSEMFGGGRGGGARGRDIQTQIEIDFLESVNGVTKKVSLGRTAACGTCHGTGGDPDAGEHTCTHCQGRGHVTRTVNTMLGAMAQQVACEHCHGRGKSYDKSCATCGGDGMVREDAQIDVEIPAGIGHGQTISMSGQGEAGGPGADTGDLLITVRVQADKRFTRSGDNITTEAHVDVAQAVLGDKIDVETVDGTVSMKVPAGTQSGEVYRIKGKGVPHLRGYGRGDHLVTVIVDIPQKLSRAQKKLFEELKKTT